MTLSPTPGWQVAHWVRACEEYRGITGRKRLFRPGHFWCHAHWPVDPWDNVPFDTLLRVSRENTGLYLLTAMPCDLTEGTFARLAMRKLFFPRCVLYTLNHHIWAWLLVIHVFPEQIPMECPSHQGRRGSHLSPLPLGFPSLLILNLLQTSPSSYSASFMKPSYGLACSFCT